MRQLGKEKARKVLKAMSSEPQQFGFIKASEEWLSQLTALPVPPYMPIKNDVFSFRAGIWVVFIVCYDGWIEVNLLNPYDTMNDHHTVAYCE